MKLIKKLIKYALPISLLTSLSLGMLLVFNKENSILALNNNTNTNTWDIKAIDGKNVSIDTIVSNANQDETILKNLKEYFAQELLSSQTNAQLKPIANKFNKELIQLINRKPDLFFNEVISPEQNPENLPFIKNGSELVVSINKELVEENTSLTISAQYLSMVKGYLKYETKTFNINGFITNKTQQVQVKYSIANYTYIDPINQKQVTPSEMTANEFIYSEASGGMSKKILIDFINKNINNIFDYTISITKCNDINNNLKVEYNSLIVKFKIINYVVDGGNLVLDTPSTETWTLTIIGFKPQTPIPESEKTTPKVLSIEEIEKKYYQSDFPILSNISAYLAATLTTSNGYKNEEFVSELVAAINTDPYFWLNNPVSGNENALKLPIVQSDSLVDVTTTTNGNKTKPTTRVVVSNQSLEISLNLLTRPEYTDERVDENDYKTLIIKINPSGLIGFGTNAPKGGCTSFNDNNDFDNTPVYDKTTSVKIDNSKVGLGSLDVDAVDNLYKNNINKLVTYVESFLIDNANTLFVNILKDTRFIIDSSSLKWENNEINIQFKLSNYYKDGTLTEGQSTTFTLNINNFDGQKDDQWKLIVIISCSVGGGLIIIGLIVWLILYLRKKQQYEQKKDEDRFSTYKNWKG